MVIRNSELRNQEDKDTKLLQKNCIDYFCKIVSKHFSLWILFSTRKHSSRMRTTCLVNHTCFTTRCQHQWGDPEVNKFEQVSSDGHQVTSRGLGWGQGIPEVLCPEAGWGQGWGDPVQWSPMHHGWWSHENRQTDTYEYFLQICCRAGNKTSLLFVNDYIVDLHLLKQRTFPYVIPVNVTCAK